MRKNIFSLGMLFASKSGAVLVGIIFLPWFHRLLGDSTFGIVAVILSFQAFLIMLDFGMATLVARDVAVHASMGKHHSMQLWRDSEALLSLFYGLLMILGVFVLMSVDDQYLSTSEYMGMIVLFFFLVLQNVAQSAIVASRQYVLSSLIQIIGVLGRAIVTVLALMYIDASLAVFIAAQVFVSSIHWFVTRYFCKRVLCVNTIAYRVTWKSVFLLLKRGKPLLMAGLAGAAIVQLDKPIILAFVSAKDVGIYFLASSFAMLPLFILAAPIVQYFQPTLIEAISSENIVKRKKVMKQFFMVLVTLVLLPSLLLWLQRDMILMLWLQDSTLAIAVSEYVKILLFAAMAGAMGYLPYVVLVAYEDFFFQAKLSWLLTIIALLLVVIFATMKRVDVICWVYVGYHFLASLILSLRAKKIMCVSFK